jgi:hypothetical protein
MPTASVAVCCEDLMEQTNTSGQNGLLLALLKQTVVFKKCDRRSKSGLFKDMLEPSAKQDLGYLTV